MPPSREAQASGPLDTVVGVGLAGLAGSTVFQAATAWTPLSPWVAGAAGVAVALALWARLAGERTAGGTTDAEESTSPTRDYVALFALLVVGLVLRLLTLSSRPAWDDEMWTLRNTWPGDWANILNVAFDDFWPPLYYLGLDVVARLGGIGITNLRLPSVAFGVVTLGMMFLVGRQLMGTRRAGLMSVALTAGWTAHVFYSQEARVYALVVMLATMSAYVFYEAFWSGRVDWRVILATVLLTYAHSFVSWYFVAAMWAYVAIVTMVFGYRRLLRPALINQILVLVLQVPLGLAFVHARLTGQIEVPLEWATGSDEAFAGAHILLDTYASMSVRSVAAILFQMALALLLVREVAWPTQHAETTGDEQSRADWLAAGIRRGALFGILWVTVPVLCSVAVTALTALDSLGAWRYHLTILPGLAVLFAGGAAALRSPAARLAVIVLLVAIPAYELPKYYLNFDRPALDEAAHFILEQQNNEPILVGNGIRTFAYYYRDFYPRIGSPEWDDFVAEHEGRDDEYIFPNDYKIGNRLSNERLPRPISYLPVSYPLQQDVEGRDFWLVTYPAEAERHAWFDSQRCAQVETSTFYHVEVRRCLRG